MITKEQWLKLVSKVDQTFEDEFKAEFNSPELMFPIVQRLLQQTQCTTLLELIEQMLKEENEALGKAGFYEQYKKETHANQKYCLAIVKQMIEARQPVA